MEIKIYKPDKISMDDELYELLSNLCKQCYKNYINVHDLKILLCMYHENKDIIKPTLDKLESFGDDFVFHANNY